jgi:hypothetical protein
MGRTFRKSQSQYDEDDRRSSTGKAVKHSNNKVRGGMRVINDYALEDEYDDDYFDDTVGVADEVVINKRSDNSTS